MATLQDLDHVFNLETGQHYPGNMPTLQLYKKKKTLLNFLEEIMASFGNSTTLQEIDHVFTLETSQYYPGNLSTLQLYKKKNTLLKFLEEILASFGNSTTLQGNNNDKVKFRFGKFEEISSKINLVITSTHLHDILTYLLRF